MAHMFFSDADILHIHKLKGNFIYFYVIFLVKILIL